MPTEIVPVGVMKFCISLTWDNRYLSYFSLYFSFKIIIFWLVDPRRSSSLLNSSMYNPSISTATWLKISEYFYMTNPYSYPVYINMSSDIFDNSGSISLNASG